MSVVFSFRSPLLLLALYLVLSSSSVLGQSDSSSEEDKPLYWDNGLWFSRPRLKLKIGGQAQLDNAGFFSDQEEFALENGVEWRRAQIYTTIQLGKRFSFKFQWGFQGQPPRLKDAWMQLSFPKLGMYVRGGRFSSTFGLEKETSSNDLMFLEESLVTAFVPRQETGFLIHSQSSRRRWDIGFSSGAKEYECLLCDILGVTGRYSTGLELGRKDRLLHLGGDFSRRWHGPGEMAQYRARPESHIAPVIVNTGKIAADRVNTALIESAFNNGPFSVQSESGWAWVKSPGGELYGFFSFYVYGSYTLTGEPRPYNASRGTFGSIRPKREFRDGDGGMGAFVVAARYSYIDLNDRDVRGGTLGDLSFALNWYPTRHARAMFNAIRAKREVLEAVWVFQFRLQLAY